MQEMDTMVNLGLERPYDRTPSGSPKIRSFSDSISTLQPSPNIRETTLVTKDDHALPPSSPRTPRRADFLSRGLSLQMPPKFTTMPAPSTSNSRTPLSPQLDPSTSYGSPATSLPRHSRGLDFSRACTNLHHSTLAEQSSPDSSPIITQKGMLIPSRKGSITSMMLDSPNLGPGSGWLSMGNAERSAISSSVGSINMLADSSGSSESDDADLVDMDDNEDSIFTTPQVHRLGNANEQTPYASRAAASPGEMWSNNFSPATASLMKNFQRTRLRKGRSRKSSSSASGQSAVPSPRTTSPPPLRSIESANGYFNWPKIPSSRRESLALGTDNLHLSSSNDSGDESTPAAPSTPGVVRRPVTRRGNLLPKTKGFARIRAALAEESAPVDTDVRREAETIRQVRERDTNVDIDISSVPNNASSPSLGPTMQGLENSLEDIPEDSAMAIDSSANGKGMLISFGRQASKHSGGLDYWNRFDKDTRTPPPPAFGPRGSSSMSDVNMDSPGDSTIRSASVVSAHEPPIEDSIPPPSSSGSGFAPRKFGKRSRDDDFDIGSIKRRAVSPSLSTHNNSPIVTQSPRDREQQQQQQRDLTTSNTSSATSNWGGPPKFARESSTAASSGVPQIETARSNSGGNVSTNLQSSASLAPKRVGLQGMTDTNDGLMKMSIE